MSYTCLLLFFCNSFSTFKCAHDRNRRDTLCCHHTFTLPFIIILYTLVWQTLRSRHHPACDCCAILRLMMDDENDKNARKCTVSKSLDQFESAAPTRRLGVCLNAHISPRLSFPALRGCFEVSIPFCPPHSKIHSAITQTERHATIGFCIFFNVR